MADLRVELYGELIGHLEGADSRSFTFRAEPSAIQTFGLGSTVLSRSVPLQAVPTRRNLERQRNYFSELLPEGKILEALASRIRVSETDTLRLLAHYGRDVAGAVQIYDPDAPGEPKTPRTTPVTDAELEVMLQNTSLTPLGNAWDSGKSSLAGVQDKIVLARIGDAWHQVHDGYPSTHIIKPEPDEFPTIVFDEEYCSRLSRHLRLATHATYLQDFKSVTGLVIERFDRTAGMPPERTHQEDMNQALGAYRHEKYQQNGGKVSLQRIAQLFAKNGDGNSLERLLALNTLSVAVGNVDMHAKNLSILHYPDGSFHLAPAYDVVPLRRHPNDKKMALAINGKYVHSQISLADIVEEAHSWQMRRDPGPLIEHTLRQILEFVDSASPHERAHPALVDDVKTFVGNLLDGKPAGDPIGAD